MSLASDSPVHSSSSDDLAAFIDGALDSCSNSSSDSIPEDYSEVADHGSKRRKLERLKTLGVDEEEIEEASSSMNACEHPGSFGNMCFVCGQTLEESGVSFRYIHKSIRLNQDEISRLRDSDLRLLHRQRKLYLVLDLDHTLLNSTILKDLKPEEEYLKSHTHSLQDVSGGNIFMLEFMNMMTKLRPFVHSFLKEAAEMFVMYIYTMGDRPYARQMAKLLDPKGEYFGDRIISRDDGTVRHQKSLDVVLGQESCVLILDDTENAWPNHKDNLIVIERYHFFASSCKQFEHKYKSLSQLKSDESEPDGALATVLKVLKQAHALFFQNVDEEISNRDLRLILKEVRKEILKGCKVVFSRVFPTKAQPEDHPLWKMAEELGATCATEVDASVTHVVAMDVGTEKARWAVREKKFVVHRGWIDAAYYLWKKQPEENFGLEQLKKQKSTVVFVLGGPGSGKGTQCANIVKHFRYTHFSAGDLLRAEIRSGSESGAMIQSMINEGRIVPSEITVKLLCKAMEESDSDKFLIDGFPRNEENRIKFEDVANIKPAFVLFFDCPEEELKRRIMNRNQGREDENVETLKKRFKVFVESTLPVVNNYESKGKLRKINAAKPSEEVFEAVKALFTSET